MALLVNINRTRNQKAAKTRDFTPYRDPPRQLTIEEHKQVEEAREQFFEALVKRKLTGRR